MTKIRTWIIEIHFTGTVITGQAETDTHTITDIASMDFSTFAKISQTIPPDASNLWNYSLAVMDQDAKIRMITGAKLNKLEVYEVKEKITIQQ